MKYFRLLVFTILFLGVVAAGMVTCFGLGSEASLLNADFYEQQFTQHNIYELSQRYVLMEIRSGINQQLAEPVRDALMHAIERSFSPEWTRQETSRLIENLLGYLKNQEDVLDLTIDLRPRQNLLLQDYIQQFRTLPPANSALADMIEQQSERLLSHISQFLHLPETIDITQNTVFSRPETQQYMQAFRQYYPYTAYLYYVLLGLLAMLILVRGFAAGLRWFGLGLVLASILCLVAINAGDVRVERYIIEHVTGNSNWLSLGANPAVLARILKTAVQAAFMKTTLMLGGVGVLLAGCGFYWERLQRHSHQSRLGA